MKIVVIGATGVVGKAVVAGLSPRHEVVQVGKTRGAHQVDIKDSASIAALFKRIGKFDALVSTVGKVHFGELADMTEKEFAIGLKDKLMGQVNLVLLGRDHVNDGGSFTLTSGLLSHDPIRRGRQRQPGQRRHRRLRACRGHRVAPGLAHQFHQSRPARSLRRSAGGLFPRP